MDGTKVGQSEKDDPTKLHIRDRSAAGRRRYVVAGSFRNKLFAAAGKIAADTAAEMHRKQAEPESKAG